MLGIPDVANDLGAVTRLGPQLLLATADVLDDDGVRRPQNRLRRPVILFQQNGLRVWIVLLKLLDVADRRTPEGINRLIGIAHHDELPRGDPLVCRVRTLVAGPAADELTDQLVLRMVGVLILVDHEVTESAPIVLSDIGERL